MLTASSVSLSVQIEDAISLICEGRESLESCALRFGERWPSMRNRVEVALLLQEIGQQHKDRAIESFDKDSIRVNFRRQLALQNSPTPARNRLTSLIWPHRWLGRVVVSLLVLGLFSSLFVAAVEASAPGDWLYGAKVNLVDQTGNWLAFSAEDKAAAQLSYADRRLTEIQQSVNQDRYDGLDQALASYDAAVNQAATVSNPVQAEPLTKKLQQDQQILTRLQNGSKLPPAARRKLSTVQARIQERLQASKRLTGSPTPPPTGTANQPASKTPQPSQVQTALPNTGQASNKTKIPESQATDNREAPEITPRSDSNPPSPVTTPKPTTQAASPARTRSALNQRNRPNRNNRNRGGSNLK